MSSNDNWESQLSPVEKNTFVELFKKVDADNKGIVLQDEAFPFFKTSNIPENILTQFWNTTDSEKKGFLTDKEFCIMLKLIACAQNGIMINDDVLATKAPLPVFGSNNMTSPRPAPQMQQPQPQVQQSPSNIDIVSPENRTKYIGLFQSFGPVNNILNGDRAKAAFMRSGLPPAVLQNIWNLADTRKSGTLNQTEFIIAMHYIENVMKGAGNLPTTLPANVYASATGRAVAPSPLVRNNTLQVNSPPAIPSRSPVMQRRAGVPLDIPSDDYQKYATFFHQLDTDNSSFVTGADAVVFFKHSGLPEADLARIWDLADTNSSGQLNEKEFAIAMHLINRKNAGGDIPSAISTVNIVSSVNQPAYQQQQQQQNTEDLLGLFSDFSAPPPTSQPPAQTPIQQQHTSTSFNIPQQQPSFTAESSHPQPIQQQHTSTSFNPNLFTPSSNFAADSSHLQTVQNQLHTESQAVGELQKQVDQQKEALAKIKQQADEAERQLEAERKKKEDLTKELQMYKQEIKHYATRIEAANEETEKLKKENQELEKEKEKEAASKQQQQQPAPATSPVPPHNDFFSLSASRSGGQLFAKVDEASPVLSQHTGSTVQSQNKFDPFAGFKATQSPQTAPSPTVSLNKLKEDSKRSNSPNVDISDIESKFPDLSTMEENFKTPTSPPPAAAPSPAPVSPSVSTTKETPKTDIYASLFSKPNPVASTSSTIKKDPNSKYGFDLSAFEAPSATASPFETKSNVKDELSSLFGSPSTSTNQPKPSSDFDNIFGAK